MKIAQWFERVKTFFHEVNMEMKKVTWPSREQVRNYIIVVFIASFSIAVVIGIWDLALLQIMRQITGLGN